MILILMDVFQCEVTQLGVNADHPLPPTPPFGEREGKAEGSVCGEMRTLVCSVDSSPPCLIGAKQT